MATVSCTCWFSWAVHLWCMVIQMAICLITICWFRLQYFPSTCRDVDSRFFLVPSNSEGSMCISVVHVNLNSCIYMFMVRVDPNGSVFMIHIPPKGGWGCLMSPSCLESQGCHLIPLSYLLACFFSAKVSCSFCLVIFLLMVHFPDFFPETSPAFFFIKDRL